MDETFRSDTSNFSNPSLPTSLLQLLSNSLVLHQTTPYLPPSSLLTLGATSKSLQTLFRETPTVYRYLDLTKVRSAQFEIAAIDHGGEVWRNVQLDENVTEDDFYGGPLRGIFNKIRRQRILQHVQTLILDGLSVTSDILSDIITQDHFNVRILSLRGVQNLNERKLQQALLYAVRSSRAEGTPKLRAIYIFGPKDPPAPPRQYHSTGSIHQDFSPSDAWSSDGGVVHGLGAQIGAQIGSQWNQKSSSTLTHELACGADKWYQAGGKVLIHTPTLEWANTMLACQDVISFDAVLCNGPRHSPAVLGDGKPVSPWYQSSGAHLSSRVATHSVGGCFSCKRAPEDIAKFKREPLERFPLLAPPPLHSSTVKAAKTPFPGFGDELLLRCTDCLRSRFCENCHKWWCEDCYEIADGGGFFVPGSATHALEDEVNTPVFAGGSDGVNRNAKVYMGLCVEDCLVTEMMAGAGSNGMWG
ncbi:uncharacterized protein RCO7_11147 [Rhynchosporium graminicola]|uniref:Uncharacterized protein n=1 Tax=Rhynchosporium graminicola TaxID=2792576 RepID=A0A1E1LQL2_9HELO|nr:uncharacterized protein RCO7_11147 [Rhynchosporium commune]